MVTWPLLFRELYILFNEEIHKEVFIMVDIDKLYTKINWSFTVTEFWMAVARISIKISNYALAKAERQVQRSIELIKQIPVDKCSPAMKAQLSELREIGLI